ncbi:MAG: YdcF family protein [Polyangiaceae bacterium]
MKGGGVGLVVLGCRTGASRSEVAARTFHENAGQFSCVVASGGRAWPSPEGDARVVEADALAAILMASGVPAELVVRERCSHSTRENAQYCEPILTRRRIHRITLVTHAWHAARAMRHFESLGFSVDLAAVPSPSSTLSSRIHWAGHELVASLLDRFVR